MIYGRLPDTSRESTKDSKNDSFSESIKHTKTEYQSKLSEADDLIWRFLEPNPELRLGSKSGDIEIIKDHPFFTSIDWEKCISQDLEPPFIPDLEHDHDTSYFDRKLTTLTLDEEISNEISSFANDTSGIISNNSVLQKALFMNNKKSKNVIPLIKKKEP